MVDEEIRASAEEAFFEHHFEYGDDKDTSMENLESALNVYFKAYKESSKFAEMISDGEVVDIPSVVLALQNMIFAHKFEETFKKSLGGSGTIMDISLIDISGKAVEDLAAEGNALVASAKKTLNIINMEKGKYLLFTAMNA